MSLELQDDAGINFVYYKVMATDVKISMEFKEEFIVELMIAWIDSLIRTIIDWTSGPSSTVGVSDNSHVWIVPDW